MRRAYPEGLGVKLTIFFLKKTISTLVLSKKPKKNPGNAHDWGSEIFRKGFKL